MVRAADVSVTMFRNGVSADVGTVPVVVHDDGQIVPVNDAAPPAVPIAKIAVPETVELM